MPVRDARLQNTMQKLIITFSNNRKTMKVHTYKIQCGKEECFPVLKRVVSSKFRQISQYMVRRGQNKIIKCLGHVWTLLLIKIANLKTKI